MKWGRKGMSWTWMYSSPTMSMALIHFIFTPLLSFTSLHFNSKPTFVTSKIGNATGEPTHPSWTNTKWLQLHQPHHLSWIRHLTTYQAHARFWLCLQPFPIFSWCRWLRLCLLQLHGPHDLESWVVTWISRLKLFITLRFFP